MGASNSIPINVLAPPTPTTLTIQSGQSSGTAPFSVGFHGTLYRTSVGSAGEDGTVDGESIQLQISQDGGISWANTGISASTIQYATHGYYSMILAIDTSWAPGIYYFRAYYAGSPTKNLEGCEKINGTVSVLGEPSLFPLIAIVIVGAGIGYLALKK